MGLSRTAGEVDKVKGHKYISSSLRLEEVNLKTNELWITLLTCENLNKNFARQIIKDL